VRGFCRHLWLPFVLTLAFSGTVRGSIRGPAVQLKVSNDPCLVRPCVADHRPPPKTTTPGNSFYLAVYAADALGNYDGNYRGTVSFSSSDPQAKLPGDYTFVPTDEGVTLLTTATLFTPGVQTITVTDPLHGLTGTLTMSVGEAIPTLGGTAKVLLAVGLAALAISFLRRSL